MEMVQALMANIGEQSRMAELMQEGQRTFEATRTPVEQLERRILSLNDQLEAGAITWDTYARAIFDAQDRFDEMRDSMQGLSDDAAQVNDLGASLGMAFSSAFEEAILSGGRFRDVLKGILDDILRIATRTMISAPLAAAAGDFFGGIFPGRAAGGPVSSGRAYMVGERGPELFVPSTAGSIVPGGGVNVNIINNVGAQVTTRQTETAQGMSIDVMIDQAVAAKLGERGSDSNRMLRAGFGMRPTLAGR